MARTIYSMQNRQIRSHIHHKEQTGRIYMSCTTLFSIGMPYVRVFNFKSVASYKHIANASARALQGGESNLHFSSGERARQCFSRSSIRSCEGSALYSKSRPRLKISCVMAGYLLSYSAARKEKPLTALCVVQAR